MISDYFVSITVKSRVQTDDGFGGFVTGVDTLGTIRGILQRASWREQMRAAQPNGAEVYTLMTIPSGNAISLATGYIVTDGTVTAEIVSTPLNGQGGLSNIEQWTANKYAEVAE